MKKIFTLSVISILTMALFSSCYKSTYIDQDDRYWLSQERGQVVYSSPTCDFYVVQTYNGYQVIQSWDGYRPFEGTILYGNFSSYGTRSFYSPENGGLISGEVIDFWLSYGAAQAEINQYCTYY